MSHDPLQNPKKRMTANILEMNGRIQKRRPTGDMEELTSASWPSVLVRGPPPWWGPAPPPCPAPSSGWRFSLEEGGGPVSYSITCGGRQRAGVSARASVRLPLGSGGGMSPRRTRSCSSFWASLRVCLLSFFCSFLVR